jgi:hypothetical protein
MKRNKYSKEFEKEMYKIAPKKTIYKLLDIAINKYGYNITKDMLMQYLSKREIRYKGYNPNKAKVMGNKIPIGTEYTKPDGMVLVKVTPNKWKYKQRYIYEQYYKVELPKDIMVIFLDGDRTNFDINNLMAVSTPEYNCIKNKDLLSNNAMVTKTAILGARLHYKIKAKES